MTTPSEYLNTHKERFINELIDLLKIPSISADTAYTQDVLHCAEQVAEALREVGVDQVEVCETQGYPVVYGEKIIDSKLPTVLVYGHYDVQPPDPLDLWKSEPFTPTIKKSPIHPEGAIYARGAADDKGQFFMHVKAFEVMMKTGPLPCNIKFLIEGEEEIGSPSLEAFLKAHKHRLANDVVLISDTDIFSLDQPTLTVGLRGLSYVEVMVEGPKIDLHSGLYGGAVPNPINILTEMIASLHDKEGRINLPGFYKGVKIYTQQERDEMNKLPLDLEVYKQSIGIQNTTGETGYTTIERTSIRPTLDVNGIWGGYIGQGAKTVIPARAYAKISMRLVPDQSPEDITKLFENHILSLAPDSVRVTVTPFHGGKPYILSSASVEYLAAKEAMEAAFHKEVLPLYGGGSIPIVALFEEILGSKSVLMGFGLSSDAIHSPNEHYGLTNFFKGIETIPHFYQNYVEMK